MAAWLAPLAGSLISGFLGARSADKAADAQADAARQQLALQSRMYKQTRADLGGYRDMGTTGGNALMFEMGLGSRPEGYGGFTASPGYQFRLGEGTRAIEGASAAMGNSLSGNTLRDLASFGQGIASEEYGNHMNRLSRMVDVGQAAAAGTAAASSNYATGGGNALANIGNARAAGHMGVGNAWQGAINNGLGVWAYQSAMNPAPSPNASSYGIRLPSSLLGAMR